MERQPRARPPSAARRGPQPRRAAPGGGARKPACRNRRGQWRVRSGPSAATAPCTVAPRGATAAEPAESVCSSPPDPAGGGPPAAGRAPCASCPCLAGRAGGLGARGAQPRGAMRPAPGQCSDDECDSGWAVALLAPCAPPQPRAPCAAGEPWWAPPAAPPAGSPCSTGGSWRDQGTPSATFVGEAPGERARLAERVARLQDEILQLQVLQGMLERRLIAQRQMEAVAAAAAAVGVWGPRAW